MEQSEPILVKTLRVCIANQINWAKTKPHGMLHLLNGTMFLAILQWQCAMLYIKNEIPSRL
jgi:hypothetical protein